MSFGEAETPDIEKKLEIHAKSGAGQHGSGVVPATAPHLECKAIPSSLEGRECPHKHGGASQTC